MLGLVLAAAGSGSRFGSDIPKQFIPLEGKPLYLHALERFSSFFEAAVLVLPEGWEEEVENQVRSLSYRDRLILEIGGPQRQDSVYQGLNRLGEEIEIVLIPLVELRPALECPGKVFAGEFSRKIIPVGS